MASSDHIRTILGRRRGAGAVLACAIALATAGSAQAQEAGTTTAPDEAQSSLSAAPKGTLLLDARAKPRRAYSYGLKPVRFQITLSRTADVQIDVVRAKSGALERRIPVSDVPAQTPTTVTWDGLSGSGTAVRGRLRLVVRTATGTAIPFARGSASTAARASKGKRKKPKLTFGLFDYIFPVRAKHSYGDGIGAPRGDHTHQGQDISAPCGTKLVAAQGGNVKVNAYQAGGAGYYVVITTISGQDHVYMHLVGAPALTVGQTVLTGQAIGQVGSTGSSSGCHLHFEMWGSPGWFSGGTLIDPTPSLHAWDKYS